MTEFLRLLPELLASGRDVRVNELDVDFGDHDKDGRADLRLRLDVTINLDVVRHAQSLWTVVGGLLGLRSKS